MQKKFMRLQVAINQYDITSPAGGIQFDFTQNFVYRLIFM